MSSDTYCCSSQINQLSCLQVCSVPCVQIHFNTHILGLMRPLGIILREWGRRAGRQAVHIRLYSQNYLANLDKIWYIGAPVVNTYARTMISWLAQQAPFFVFGPLTPMVTACYHNTVHAYILKSFRCLPLSSKRIPMCGIRIGIGIRFGIGEEI